ncbi:Diphthamide biosynthesis protein 2 [Peltigera leucophlebia]|nr:Diphthamide biosynthesis protein 2 [Peltigera leucophlebia]
MSSTVEAPPVLSTPAVYFSIEQHPPSGHQSFQRSDDLIHVAYEVDRTAAEIREGGWKTVALQFPDDMLPEAPRVFDALSTRLRSSQAPQTTDSSLGNKGQSIPSRTTAEVKLYILGDTSYGSCCVDELAAEHVHADVVVHYGRSCLSPTARLPVIHIFTVQPLAVDPLLRAFQDTFPSRDERIILMADVPYSSHLRHISEMLHRSGYCNLFTTKIVHNPSSPLPNRTSPDDVNVDAAKLKGWHLFHISNPPKSLMLILSSRVSSMYIFPVTKSVSPLSTKSILASTASALRRRYALLTSVSTVSVFGILINTLSVKNYLYIVEHVKARIRNAEKKSYTFVVGKVNAAKVANFSEIGAWVIIGCWESSLIDSEDFWKPILTPFELELALMKDRERIWTGEWRSDFQSILDEPSKNPNESKAVVTFSSEDFHHSENTFGHQEDNGELESIPPEFDLRTGRYVSDTRPMQFFVKPGSGVDGNENAFPTRSLVKRFTGDLAVIGGELSSGAEYLRTKRTWRGLGSDYEIKYDELNHPESTPVEEGRTGIAKGYLAPDETSKR